LLSKLSTSAEPLTVEIRNTSAGAPGTSVLASGSIPNSAIGPNPAAFVPVTFATPAAVTAGTQYALVTYTTHVLNDSVGWFYQSATDPYSGGAGFISNDPVPPLGNWDDFMGDDDYAFKTYVAPPPSTTTGSPTTPTVVKKKCKKHKKKHSAESAKKKCKKKKKK
jgi:hypothetical protein